jgi:hypothetical protein
MPCANGSRNRLPSSASSHSTLRRGISDGRAIYFSRDKSQGRQTDPQSRSPHSYCSIFPMLRDTSVSYFLCGRATPSMTKQSWALLPQRRWNYSRRRWNQPPQKTAGFKLKAFARGCQRVLGSRSKEETVRSGFRLSESQKFRPAAASSFESSSANSGSVCCSPSIFRMG